MNASQIFLEKNALIRERIIEAIKEKDISKKQLAEAMGILPQALARVLRPHSNLTMKTICMFEAALNIEIIRCYYYN